MNRYEYWKESDTAYDTKRRYGQYFHIIDKKECVDLLNEQDEQIKELKKENQELLFLIENLNLIIDELNK